jgi:hypothetical protein
MSSNIILNKNLGILKDFPKPTGSNDFKLQAILVYALARLEHAVYNYDYCSEEKSVFKNKDDEKFVRNFYCNFVEDLKSYVPKFDDLEQYIEKLKNLGRPPTVIETIAYSQCVPLIKYYNTIVLECEKIIKDNGIWIPDLFAVSLIVYWRVEHSKNTSTYHALLSKYDFQSVLDKYNHVAVNNKATTQESCIKLMYDAADMISQKLIKTNGLNTKKRGKKRKNGKK